jgi:hypothetical protein
MEKKEKINDKEYQDALEILRLHSEQERQKEIEENRKKVQPKKKKSRRPLEYTKIIVNLVVLTYYFGVIFGARIVWLDPTQLPAYLGFIGVPTATAIGFYCWKAKAENAIKMANSNKNIDVSDIINATVQ